jgi:hypothetical protein
MRTKVLLPVHCGKFDENLLSVNPLCKDGHRIILDYDGSYIERKTDGQKYPIRRTSNGFIVTLTFSSAADEHRARSAQSIDEMVQQAYEDDAGLLEQYGSGKMDLCSSRGHPNDQPTARVVVESA